MPSPEAMGDNGPDRVTLPEIAGLSRSRKGEICYTPEQTKTRAPCAVQELPIWWRREKHRDNSNEFPPSIVRLERR